MLPFVSGSFHSQGFWESSSGFLHVAVARSLFTSEWCGAPLRAAFNPRHVLNPVQAQGRRKGSGGAWRGGRQGPTLTALSCRHEQPGGAGAGGARLQDALPAGLPHLSPRAHDPLLEKGPGGTAHFRVLAGLPGRLLHRHRAPVSTRWKPVRPGSAERGLIQEASPPPPH